jgi:prepilin-type N-terminal cleavage/methylation domain-containing protein
MHRPASNRPATRPAFTLVELLVVIGVIALLISILLPALNGAKRAANNVACAANLRSIVQAMQIYAAQNGGWVPGGPNTTGAFLFGPGISQTNVPQVSQIWDWQAPIAKIMGVQFDEGGTAAQRQARFLRLSALPQFRCPENDLIATAFTGSGGPAWPAHQSLSYVAAAIFHYLPPTNPATDQGSRRSYPGFAVPQGYVPRLTKVGTLSRKAFVACGARFTSSTQVAPTTNSNYRANDGGGFGDHGAYSAFSNAWDRRFAPGNGGSTGVDARVSSFRHGKRQPRLPADQYRFNIAFFDAHVETLGDLEGARPEFWMPKNTRFTLSEARTDVQRRYYPSCFPSRCCSSPPPATATTCPPTRPCRPSTLARRTRRPCRRFPTGPRSIRSPCSSPTA